MEFEYITYYHTVDNKEVKLLAKYGIFSAYKGETTDGFTEFVYEGRERCTFVLTCEEYKQ